MRGIADGASDAGAKWQNRRIDLMDIVVANVTVEMGELRSAVTMTPTGLEGFSFDKPAYGQTPQRRPDSVLDHCSAFAATGPATRDGKMVIGHVTWWPLTLAEQTNVMLDIKPAAGHRLLMQSYPGGIESGTDWYQNDAGVVLDRDHHPPDAVQRARARPVAFRARMAIQYGGNVDEVVATVLARATTASTPTSGSSATPRTTRSPCTSWAPTIPSCGAVRRTNGSAARRASIGATTMPRTWRSGWSMLPDPHSAPEYVPYVPMPRDLAWQDLYRRVQRADRRAVCVPGVPHGAAGRGQHDGRQGGHGGHGFAHDGVG